jgi:hypothetical protein
MNRIAVAKELVAVAKELEALERIAAGKSLGDVRALLDDMYVKQEEHEKKMEEYRRETNKMWDDAIREVREATDVLVQDLRKELVSYFNENGIGVRQDSANNGLVEVFLGSDDGVKRYQSKVSAHVSLFFKRTERAGGMLRNENGDETIEFDLKNKNTVADVLARVKKAEASGFWGAEME